MHSSPRILASLFLALSVHIAEAQEQNSLQPQAATEATSSQPEAKESIQDTLKRVERKIDDISASTSKVQAVVADEPLSGKRFGVEFNLLRPLLWGGDEKTLSGTFSIFDVDKKVEYAFPVMLSSSDQFDYGADPRGSLNTLTMDFHYRKFLGRTMNGFYLSAFTRAAYLNGLLGSDYYSSSDSYERAKEFKLGLGFGVGYRIFSSDKFYWGASLSVGRYIVGDSKQYLSTEGISADQDDEEGIFDVEFFKFGYAF